MKKNGHSVLDAHMGKKCAVLIAALLFFSISYAYGQTDTITLHMKNATVEEVLQELRNRTDADFVYNHEEVKKVPRINLDVKSAPLEYILDKCLKNTNLEYKKVNKTYVIKPKDRAELPPSIQDEKTQTIRGKVIDRDSKMSLPSATVVVLNTNPQIGISADIDGNFELTELPVGRYTLQITYIGYESALLPEIQLGSAKEVVLTVELSEKVEGMDEVVVSIKKGEPLNEMATISGKSFSVEETKRYAASISDPARMAQVFAGVSTSDDASNEIVIRGNSPNWMLWRLEGVEIPSPNHFAEEGYTSGAVSILSTNLLEKSDFYTGAFPAEYGGALSGVFDIKLRNGNNQKREYSAQIGVLGVELAAEGPFKKGYDGSYLVNYRYSTFSILNHLNIQVSENVLPSYQDLSFKVNLPTKNAGIFNVWGIGGNSDADEKYYPDTTLGESFKYGYYDHTTTGMYASGIGHRAFIGKKSYLKSTLSNSKSFSSNDYGQMDTTGVMHNSFFDDLNSGALRFTTMFNTKLSSKLTLRTGYTASMLYYDYLSKYTDEDYNWLIGIDGDGNTYMHQAYVQSKLNFSDAITLTGGLHYTHFTLNKENSLEPRLGLQFKLKNNQQIAFGFGMHSKQENLPVYFVEFKNENDEISYLNKSLKLTKSIHYVVSYEKTFENIGFKTEMYYQAISNLPVPNNPDKLFSPAFNGINPNDTLVSKGIGRNYGIEFTVQKYFTNNYYFLLTNSLFQSEYKPLNGKWYSNKFNSNYITNFVAGKEIYYGDDKMVSLNAKVLWSGGKRYLPIDLEASKEAGEAVYNFDDFNKNRTSDYLRVDVGIKQHFYRPKTEHIISLDLQNALNRMNTWYTVYDSKNEKIVEYPMAGLIPILNYRVEF